MARIMSPIFRECFSLIKWMVECLQQFYGGYLKNAQCSKTYTAHCFRATAIQGMNDAGFKIRHIHVND